MMKRQVLPAAITVGLALWILTGLGMAKAAGSHSCRRTFIRSWWRRAAKIAMENLTGTPDEKQITRAKLAAVMIARYALDADLDGQTAAVEHAALKLAKMVSHKEKIAEARKLAAALPGLKGKAGARLEPVHAKSLVDEVLDTMDPLRPRKKGGDGIHPDLQTSGPLKSLNGVEEKVRSLAKKKLSDAALKKSAREMVLFGYQMAVLAEVVADFAPAQQTKEWRELSSQMRAASISLAQAAQKKDAGAIHKAGSSLDAACNQCHSAFRK